MIRTSRRALHCFVGPLGLAGNAIERVHTCEFAAVESCKARLRLTAPTRRSRAT